MSPHRAIDYLTKPRAWREISSCVVSSREFKRRTQTIWAVAIGLGCLPEFGGKSLWLKVPCTSNTGLGSIKRELS